MSFSNVPRRLSFNLPHSMRRKPRQCPRELFPNKLTHYLRRAELIDSIRLALRSGGSLSSIINTRLLDNYVVAQVLRTAPDATSALFLVDSLKEVPHFSHDHASLHALATVLARSGKVSGIKSLVSDIKEGVFGNVLVSSMSLMRWYGVVRDTESLLNTWEEYKRKCAKWVCAESYNLIIKAYVHMKMDEKAVETFRTMIEKGTLPNCRTYTVMIEHMVEKGSLNAALKLFDLLPAMRIRRTTKQYFVLVENLVAAKRFEEVRGLLDEMKADGTLPGHAMRVALLEMKKEGFEEAVILREINPDERIKTIEISSDEDDDEDERKKIGLKPWIDPRALALALNEWTPEIKTELENTNFIWTTRLVCKIIRSFKSCDSAWEFFLWVSYQPGFTHNVYTLQRMITLAAQNGNAELVEKLISKVRIEGLKISACTFRLIIDYFGVSKNAEAALRVFQDDRSLCGKLSRANVVLLYGSLLRTLTKCKRSTDIVRLLEEMEGKKVYPDMQTYAGLARYFAEEGDVKTVERLFTMARVGAGEVDGMIYRVVLEAYCRGGMCGSAWRVYEEMKEMKIVLDDMTKKMLVKSLWKDGKRKEVAIIEENFGKNDNLSCLFYGHLWTLKSDDLHTVYDLYCSSFMGCVESS